MALKEFLSRNRSAILERWFDKVLESYPFDSTGFLKQRSKQFGNPVGHTMSKGLEGILDGLLNSKDLAEITPFIDDIVRIRAVQDLTPSQALVFLFHLKSLIRVELGAEEQAHVGDLRELDSRIDALALISFDIYAKHREKIHELKADEVKRNTYRLLQMANVVCQGKEE